MLFGNNFYYENWPIFVVINLIAFTWGCFKKTGNSFLHQLNRSGGGNPKTNCFLFFCKFLQSFCSLVILHLPASLKHFLTNRWKACVCSYSKGCHFITLCNGKIMSDGFSQSFSVNYFLIHLEAWKLFFDHFWRFVNKIRVPAGTPSKITVPTDKNSGNESKISLRRKNRCFTPIFNPLNVWPKNTQI